MLICSLEIRNQVDFFITTHTPGNIMTTLHVCLLGIIHWLSFIKHTEN